jgi:hypothetical protein
MGTDTELVHVPMAPAAPNPDDEWNLAIELWSFGRPESTRQVYLPVIHAFHRWLGAKRLAEVTLQDLQRYSNELMRSQKLRTVQRKTATIRSLLSFTHRIGMLMYNVGAALRLPPLVAASAPPRVEIIFCDRDKPS